MKISRSLATAALLFEKYLLPFVYFYTAYLQTRVISARSVWESEHQALGLGGSGLFFAILTRHTLLLLFSLLVGITLLFNRAPVEPPDNARDIFVPLLTSFSYLSYTLIGYVPLTVTQNMTPSGWRVELTAAALLLSISGYVVSIWSLIVLGRSFSILISVRKIIYTGPYKYVRHPIYLGYVFLLCGILLSSLSLFSLLATVIQLSLIIYRARLEERKLGRSSSAYRDYIARTGFLFPKVVSSSTGDSAHVA